jgi:hypothetical protein
VKKFFLYYFVLFVLVLLHPASAAFAQEPIPQAVAWTGEVTGRVFNATTEESVNGELDVMLHGWDQNHAEKLMLHGKSAEDGSYRFEEIPFEPGVLYAVMATYQDAAYFSEPFEADEQQNTISKNVSVYETTTDLAEAEVAQMHLLYFWDQGGLSVSEVYILSNNGNRTIKGADQLEDGTPVTLKFNLPEGAANLSFGHNGGSRFLQFADGFADTEPLSPGERSSQVMVSYVLPYESGMSFEIKPPLDVKNVSILVPQNGGLEVSAEGLATDGTWPSKNGDVFSVLSRDGLKAGGTLAVTLSGESTAVNQPASAVTPRSQEPGLKTGLGIGGTVLGLTMVLLGIWWWRRPLAEPALVPAGDQLNKLLAEIARLDQAQEQGEVTGETYAHQRSNLLQQARIILQERKDETT